MTGGLGGGVKLVVLTASFMYYSVNEIVNLLQVQSILIGKQNFCQSIYIPYCA